MIIKNIDIGYLHIKENEDIKIDLFLLLSEYRRRIAYYNRSHSASPYPVYDNLTGRMKGDWKVSI